MQFRPDINGLRAYAVLAVIVFHFNKEWLPGGFTGVDVFFVISGYLMTSIIFRGIDRNQFSLSSFYLARANRIIPALTLVSITTLIIGAILLAPEDLKTLGKHVAYSAGFLSNIAYQNESGYFDIASHDKWLLHTWSLSVEWQFYIIYPLIILALRKLSGPVATKAGVLIIALISFTFCLWSSFYSPENSFYQLSSRAWEMMFGGLAFLYPLRLHSSTAKMAELSGLLLILSSAFYLDESDRWPGILTLIPVVGAWLVITASRQTSILTNNPLMQRTGAWSYSIYLWHWPLFVLINRAEATSPAWLVAGIITSIVLGYTSYTLIEQKIRFSKRALRLQLITHPTVIMVVAASSLGLTVQNSDGYPERFPEAVKNTFVAVQPSPLREQCHSKARAVIDPEESCTYFGKNIGWGVIGDSHVIELSYALAESLRTHNEGVRHYSFSGCPPSYKQPDDFSRCAHWLNSAVSDLTARDDITSVIINFRYARAFFGENTSSASEVRNQVSDEKRNQMLWSFKEMIVDIASQKHQVYVMLPIPELTERMPNILSQHYSFGDKSFDDIPGQSRSVYLIRNRFFLDFFSGTTFPENVTLINPIDHFCDAQMCYAVRDGIPLYFDDDHPSVSGARLMLTPVIEKIQKAQKVIGATKDY